MPIYEYQCQSCGAVTEKLQKLSDPPLTDCPDCGKPSLEKLVSAAGFQLKGTGWYVTDFRNKGGASGGSTSSGKDSAADSKPPCASGACPAAD
jgi:putative FmdB family regulatory protein